MSAVGHFRSFDAASQPLLHEKLIHGSIRQLLFRRSCQEIDMVNLQYSDLSRDTIMKFHREHGGVSVNLSPARGKLLHSMLDQRDRIEQDLLRHVKVRYLVWHLLI